MKTVCVIYSRFSPRRDSEKSESCETQEQICLEYANKQDWKTIGMFRDEGISGNDQNKEGLEDALELLAGMRGKKVLLVYKRDRIARDVLLAELFRRRALAIRAQVVAVTGDISGEDEDPTVIFVRQIMDAVAELERKQIGQRTKDAMRTQQKAGKRISRFAPYGYTLIDGELQENPEEQKAVERIKELIALPVAQIARIMNKEFAQVARTGKWSYKTIWKIVERYK